MLSAVTKQHLPVGWLPRGAACRRISPGAPGSGRQAPGPLLAVFALPSAWGTELLCRRHPYRLRPLSFPPFCSARARRTCRPRATEPDGQGGGARAWPDLSLPRPGCDPASMRGCPRSRLRTYRACVPLTPPARARRLGCGTCESCRESAVRRSLRYVVT
jgi:hypothetical protein